jgi:hypothetical protein
MDTGPVLALEPLSTILPGSYRHLQHPQALDRLTLFLGDRSQETLPQEHTVPTGAVIVLMRGLDECR